MKKIPLRKCLVTLELCPKKELLRVVKSQDNKVFYDPTSKANGRGAYIKASLEVVEKAKKTKALEKALEIQIPDQVYLDLISEINARKN